MPYLRRVTTLAAILPLLFTFQDLAAAAESEAVATMRQAGLLPLLKKGLASLTAMLSPIVQALPSLPAELAGALRSFAGDASQPLVSGLIQTFGVMLSMLALANGFRLVAIRWLRPAIAGGPATAVLRRFIVDVIGVLAAAAAAIVGAELVTSGEGLTSQLLQALIDLTLVLMVVLLAPAILARPGEPEMRLIKASDIQIDRAAPWVVAAIAAALAVPCLEPVLLEAGMAWPAGQALALVVGLVAAVCGTIAGWRFVDGRPDARHKRRLVMGVAATFWLVWSYGVIALDFPFYFLLIRLAALATAGFILDRLLVHVSRYEAAQTKVSPRADDELPEDMEPTSWEPFSTPWQSYAQPLRHVLWFACASLTLLALAAWLGEALPDWIGQTLPDNFGRRLVVALLTMNLGYAAFEGLSAWTRARYTLQLVTQKPGGDDETIAPASRLATIMPIVRGLIGALVLGIAALTALSRLGVDVTHILAGAGILGLAISFGSQSLVRDVVAGLFYMIDDAFRFGEYIEAGRLKGNVERISIRSVQLRHHNGQLHTVPYGQLGSITNYSRDWITLKFNLRLSRDIDIDAVRKLVKKIGLEMMEDPELGKDFILPLKMQGVADVLENALVVRFKFTARPGKPTYLQRESIKRLIKAFQAEGIAFAQNAVFVQNQGDRPLSDEAAAAIASKLTQEGSQGDRAPAV